MLTANDLDKITLLVYLPIIVLIIFGRKIFFACFDEIGFKVAGYNLKTIDFIILFLITVTVVVAMLLLVLFIISFNSLEFVKQVL